MQTDARNKKHKELNNPAKRNLTKDIKHQINKQRNKLTNKETI